MSPAQDLTEDPSPRPTVAIIIPAFNEQMNIGDCLAAAVNQSEPANEIIVVDNRSTDATVAMVEAVMAMHPDAPIRLISQTDVQGLVPTRNAGFAAATSDVLGRIDADSLIEHDWVEQVRRTFVDRAVDAATGPVNYYDMPLRRWGLWADDRMRQLVLRVSRENPFLFGSNMAVRADSWRAIADDTCLDAHDVMHEDIDIALHLTAAGLRIDYVSTMVSGMSARRLENSPRDYSYYVTRFERTYAHHGVRSIGVRTPMVVFLAVYPPLKLMRMLHSRISDRFGMSVAGLRLER